MSDNETLVSPPQLEEAAEEKSMTPCSSSSSSGEGRAPSSSDASSLSLSTNGSTTTTMSWKSWFNQKFCEGLVLLDVVWYQVMHIPWFLRNELNLISHIDEYCDSSNSTHSSMRHVLLKSFGHVVRNLKRIIYGRDHEKNFYLRYGMRYANQRARQTLNEYVPFKTDSNRVYIFLHGGTWHSGHADLYHRFATFVAGQENHRCYNLNYTLYPSVHVEEMIEDVDRGVNFVIDRVKETMDKPEIILVGHSAGAHLFSLIALNKVYNIVNMEPKTNWALDQVRKLVLLCGVYDMATHYLYEKTRKVHDISPMWKICKGTHRFPLFSPTLIIRSNAVVDQGAVNKWPSTSIAHGKKDLTCPWIQSQTFHQELSALCPNSSIQLHPLDQFFHGDLITNFMGIERDFEKRETIWKIINSSLVDQ